MPLWMHAIFLLFTICTAGLGFPLWMQADKRWKRDHTVTTIEE
jgi:hypothetical protein